MGWEEEEERRRRADYEASLFLSVSLHLALSVTIWFFLLSLFIHPLPRVHLSFPAFLFFSPSLTSACLYLLRFPLSVSVHDTFYLLSTVSLTLSLFVSLSCVCDSFVTVPFSVSLSHSFCCFPLPVSVSLLLLFLTIIFSLVLLLSFFPRLSVSLCLCCSVSFFLPACQSLYSPFDWQTFCLIMTFLSVRSSLLSFLKS